MRSPSFQALDEASSSSGAKKLCLQWRLARKGEALPFYEDVGLGSLGALAGDTALFQLTAAGGLRCLRVGQTLAEHVGPKLAGADIDGLDANFRDPLKAGLMDSFASGEPTMALARSVSDGLVVTFEILSLPLCNRWGGTLLLAYIKQRSKTHDLVEAIYRSTTNGLVALAAVPQAEGTVDFQVVSLNAGAAAIFGRPETEIRWRHLSDLIPSEDTARLYPQFLAALDSQIPSEFEFGFGRGAAKRHLRISVAPIGNLLGVTVTDISDIKQREESVKSLFESNPMPLMLYERDSLKILRVNDALVSRYGYPRERWERMTLPDLHPPEERPDVAALAGRSAADGPEQRLWRHVTEGGQVLDIHAYTRDLLFGERACVLASILDVTEQRRAQARIVYLAHHDHLTSLANRVLFRTVLDDSLDAARRGECRLAVHSIDLDHFKRVNDTLGHSVGDEVLKAVADRIRGVVSGRDLVARLGGDEFAVIQIDPAGDDDASALALRMIDTLSAPYRIEDHEVQLGASVGIAIAPRDATEADPILQHADVALYRAKADGKGVHRFYVAGMNMGDQEKRLLEEDLREALEDGQFFLHYQPIFDVGTETIVACEALVRWAHPKRGIIPPCDFIPLAEETGLIGPLGDWVLREACREAALWPDHVSVAVNLSALQFAGGGLDASIAAALAGSGLSPGRLELEITESVLLSENADHRALLQRLRDSGVSVAIDDFGTGYSSLSYLRRFPVDKIKIDRCFVGDLGEDPGPLAIIRAIVSLGRSFGIATVAEGVETPDQLRQVRAEGCSQVQGFLLSRPVPAAVVRERLAAETAAGVQARPARVRPRSAAA